MFGISNNVRSRVVRECTPELFRQVTTSRLVAEVCAEIEDALEKTRRGEMTKEDFDTFKSEHKKRLPIFTPHATFRGGRRLNAEAIPSGLSMYDIDHIGDPRGYWDGMRKMLEEKGLLACVVLAHITPSTEGLRLFFVIPPHMTLGKAQKWMSEQLGDKEYDQSVKDYARSSFAVPAEYILYIAEEELFKERQAENVSENASTDASGQTHGSAPTGMPGEEKQASAPTNRRGGPVCPPDNTPEEVSENTPGDASDQTIPAPTAEDALPPAFKGIPYAAIIARWFKLCGGEPQTGERNDKLHRLAAHLRYITDNDEALLLKIIPRYGLGEEEMKGLIHNACTGRFSFMPKVMHEVLALEGAGRISPRTATPGKGGEETEDGRNLSPALPPALPQKLPPLIKLLLSRTPDLYRPAVAHAVFPALAAHLWKVRFKYIDNVEHEATLMNVLMAGTGAGKDCISAPISRIMADIRLRDEENLRREREWKQEVNSKGANKDKRQRPEGLVIQEIDADMTNPAFVMRTAEADGHFLYTKMNEIDQFDALRGSGRGAQQFQIMCLAFDPGNRYGQTRVGAQSVTEKVCIRFNWNAATTILKGQRYFANVLTDGPLSRINFCTIPEREIGADMPVYGFYGSGFDEELRPFIENLSRAVGLVDCPQAFKFAIRLKEENAEFARLSQSRVYENLSFRANVIAYLKACVLYVAGGCRWDKVLEDFIRWSLKYDLWCKMEFFGAAIEEAMQGAGSTKPTPGRQNLLELLPERFRIQDAELVRQRIGMDIEGTKNMLYQWTHRGYILHLTNDNYQKSKK